MRVTLVAVLLALVLPRFAGTVYTSSIRTEAAGQQFELKTRAWASGEKLRTEVIASDNPLLPVGNYVLRTPGTQALLVVDPTCKTFFRWDLDKYISELSAGMQGKVEIRDSSFKKLAEDDGGVVAGLHTRHYRFELRYTMVTLVYGIERRTPVVIEEDFWAAPELTSPELSQPMALAGLMDKLSSFSPEVDEMVAAATRELKGVVVRQATRTTATGHAGEIVSSSTMEIADVRTEHIADALFAVPADCHEVEMGLPSNTPPLDIPDEEPAPVSSRSFSLLTNPRIDGRVEQVG